MYDNYPLKVAQIKGSKYVRIGDYVEVILYDGYIVTNPFEPEGNILWVEPPNMLRGIVKQIFACEGPRAERYAIVVDDDGHDRRVNVEEIVYVMEAGKMSLFQNMAFVREYPNSTGIDEVTRMCKGKITQLNYFLDSAERAIQLGQKLQPPTEVHSWINNLRTMFLFEKKECEEFIQWGKAWQIRPIERVKDDKESSCITD